MPVCVWVIFDVQLLKEDGKTVNILLTTGLIFLADGFVRTKSPQVNPLVQK